MLAVGAMFAADLKFKGRLFLCFPKTADDPGEEIKAAKFQERATLFDFDSFKASSPLKTFQLTTPKFNDSSFFDVRR